MASEPGDDEPGWADVPEGSVLTATPGGVAAELAAAGLAMVRWWTGTGGQFGLSLSVPA
jgi:hypothetical protein